MIGLQAPNEEGPLQIVEVAVDSMVRKPESLADLRGVPHLAVQGGATCAAIDPWSAVWQGAPMPAGPAGLIKTGNPVASGDNVLC